MSADSIISHTTPADGNIYLDLGFAPADAVQFLAESELRLAELLTKATPIPAPVAPAPRA